MNKQALEQRAIELRAMLKAGNPNYNHQELRAIERLLQNSLDGTSGQDRESYSDDQDRDSYSVKD